MMLGVTFHDWIQGIVVVATTSAVMYSIVVHGAIPGDLAPSWALIIGAYIGGRISQAASQEASTQAKEQTSAAMDAVKTNGTSLH